MDVRPEHLQGVEIKDSYLKPPIEGKCQGLWRLKTVYGLKDAVEHGTTA